MKKIIALFIAIISLTILLTVPTFAAGNGSIAMSSGSGKQGDTVTLNVNMPSNPGLVTMTIRVSYDTDVLQLINVSDPGLLVGAQLNTSYGSPYTISWVDGAATANNTKTGTIATFTFKIKDSAKIGKTTVSLHFVDSYDSNYNENSFTASSGTITVNCKNHSFGSYTSNATQHSRTCSTCGYIEKVNHTWNSGTVTKQPSCKESGSKTYTCTTCGATKTETLSKTNTHSYGAWSKVDNNSHKHTCSVCQKDETVKHTWNSGKVIKQATCKEAGEKSVTCTACSATKTEVIAKLSTHTYDHGCDKDCNVCGATRTITHRYGDWHKDANGHWKECSVCKDKKDAAAHIPGAEPTETTAQTCTACGYVLKPTLAHTHSYTESWTTDENGHWHACSGCEEKSSYATHNFENACDSACDVCGYSRDVSHNFENTWSGNAESHYHVCVGCGEKSDVAAHVPGAEATAETAQNCTVCGYEIAPALGEPTTEPTTDTTDATDHTTPDDSADSSFPWWIFAITSGVEAIIIVFLLLKRKH